jgi:hypothetical protein
MTAGAGPEVLTSRAGRSWRQIARSLAQRGFAPLDTGAKLWRETKKVAATRGLSLPRILLDLILLRANHSVRALNYLQFRLFEPGLTRQEKLSYITGAPRLWALLTPKRYGLLYANKLVFNCFFGGCGLPVAEIYAVYDSAVGHTMDGRRLRTAANLRRWMAEAPGEGFVFKGVRGAKGHQILVLAGRDQFDPAVFVTLAGERYDAERLIGFVRNAALDERLIHPRRHHRGKFDSYILQERLRPHPVLAAFVGPTVCCVRAQTFIARDGSARLLAAVFKLQPGRVGVDHLVYGAVGCWVDPETGVLGRGRTRDSLADVTTVPGTDRSFVGFQLPHWPEVKAVALRAAAAFPWARAIGWDIAITDRGPVLLEGNPAWSATLIQLPAPGGLLTGEFKALVDSLSGSGRRTATV